MHAYYFWENGNLIWFKKWKCSLCRYHNRATLVVSALQVEKHPVVNDIAHQLQLSEISRKLDGDTDTAASIGADSKSMGVSSPFKVNRYVQYAPIGKPAIQKFYVEKSNITIGFYRFYNALCMIIQMCTFIKARNSAKTVLYHYCQSILL